MNIMFCLKNGKVFHFEKYIVDIQCIKYLLTEKSFPKRKFLLQNKE